MANDKTTPPAPDPRPARNPGYAEPQPRDKGDARQSPEPKTRDPDEDGTERETDAAP